MPYALPREIALYEGQPVVSVCATSRAIAEDAVAALDIDYEPLPHLSDVEKALAEDAPILHPELGTNLLVQNPRGDGDPDAGLAESEVVVDDRFRINRVSGLPMETRAILASYVPGVRELEVSPPPRPRTCSASSSPTACASPRPTSASPPTTAAAPSA